MPPLGNRKNPTPGKTPQTPVGRLARGPVIYIILLLILAYVLLTALGGSKQVKELTLSDYLNKIRDGQVATAEIFSQDERVEGKLKDGNE